VAPRGLFEAAKAAASLVAELAHFLTETLKCPRKTFDQGNDLVHFSLSPLGCGLHLDYVGIAPAQTSTNLAWL
jgi:hypothetical protein